jgi:hypothetical protein
VIKTKVKRNILEENENSQPQSKEDKWGKYQDRNNLVKFQNKEFSSEITDRLSAKL